MLGQFTAFCGESGFLPSHWGEFFTSIIDHILNFFTSLPHRDITSEYTARIGGEPASQCFPNWEIKYKRPLYEADKAKEDKEWSEEICTKHTPGLFIVCCPCSQKNAIDLQC